MATTKTKKEKVTKAPAAKEKKVTKAKAPVIVAEAKPEVVVKEKKSWWDTVVENLGKANKRG